MNFQSEYGEDLWLWENHHDYFRFPRYYVDLGCAGPVYLSQTYFLRELGWKGLHIDGDESWAKEWNGQMIHAIVSDKPSVHFARSHAACLSRVEDGIPNAPAVSLQSILEAFYVDKVGFMSVDVEGHEYEALRSFDIGRYEPQFLVVEYNTAGKGEDFRAKEYLESQGYTVIHTTPSNHIFKRD